MEDRNLNRTQISMLERVDGFLDKQLTKGDLILYKGLSMVILVTCALGLTITPIVNSYKYSGFENIKKTTPAMFGYGLGVAVGFLGNRYAGRKLRRR
jgi:hypothetical protein